MPDLLAGTIITAADTPPTVENTQTVLFTTTITGYGVGTSGGSYVDCGVAFTGPTTGRVTILWRAQMDQDTAGQFTAVSPQVRTGATVGSGTLVLAADDSRAVIMSGTDVMTMGSSLLLTGLTPGDPYNVRLHHKVGGGTGSIERREVIVQPAT